MRNIKTLAPLFLLLFPVYSALAQTNYVASTIIQFNGDTLKGEIDYKEWVYNPKMINFRANKNKSPQVFKPKDIKGFTILSKNEKYQTAIVKVNNESLDSEHPKMSVYESVDSIDNKYIAWETDTVFLSVVAQGRLNLFELSYYVDSKAHYFIQKGDGKIEELIYRRVKLHNHDTLGFIKIQTYRKQLHYLMIDYVYEPDITLLPYTKARILKLVRQYNEAAGQSFYVVKERKSPHYLSIMAGMMQPKLRLADYYNYNGANYSGETTPSFGLAYEIRYNRLRNKLAFGVELNLAPYKANFVHIDPFYSRTVTIHYQINTFSTKVAPYVLYHFTANKLQPYVKAGVSIQFISTPNIERYTTDQNFPEPFAIAPLIFSKRQFNYLVALGLKYNNWFIEPRLDGAMDKIGENEKRAIGGRFSVLAGYSFRLTKDNSKK
jgi:hypothetical protein